MLLADDHSLVRGGLKMILEAEPDMRVVAEAGDGAEAVEQALANDVDLVVLDVSMPRLTGLQAAAALSARKPSVRIVMLSMHANEQYLCEAARAGASGYVLKSAVDRELVDACRGAMRGERFSCPSEVGEPVRTRVERVASGETLGDDPLSTREREVLKLIAEGYTARQIGASLVISEKTVDRHRANLLEKLGERDRLGLARYAIRTGLVEA